MNVRNDVIINSPNNKDETCTEFVIDDITKPFMLNGTTEVGEDYTFSAWIKSSEESSINIYGESIPITNEWKRKRVTFNATGRGIRIYFDKVGTYYFYKSQLELGKVMSDASPSPEDIKASLEVKINKENLISEINASADIITLNGNRFIVNSDNLTIAEDGTLTAVNGIFSGRLTSDEGKIAGFTISENAIYNGPDSSTSDTQGVYIGTDAILSVSDSETDRYVKIWNGASYYTATGTKRSTEVSGEGINIISSDLTDTGDGIWDNQIGLYLNSNDEFSVDKIGSIGYYGIRDGYDNEILTWDVSKPQPHIHDKVSHSDGKGYVTLGEDSGYYYFRPGDSENYPTYCGSRSNPWYKIFAERLEVTANKPIFKYSYDNTVSYATNCHINSEGKLSRTTNTSSKTIKHDIVELSSESELSANKLYDVNVYQFKYNDDIITDKEDARYGRDLVGFIIEDLNKKYPIAVDKPSEDVREWSWNAQYLIPPMLKLIQEQNKRINILERKINDVN